MWNALQILAPGTRFVEDNFSTDGRMGWGDGSGSNASDGEQQLKLYSPPAVQPWS